MVCRYVAPRPCWKCRKAGGLAVATDLPLSGGRPEWQPIKTIVAFFSHILQRKSSQCQGVVWPGRNGVETLGCQASGAVRGNVAQPFGGLESEFEKHLILVYSANFDSLQYTCVCVCVFILRGTLFGVCVQGSQRKSSFWRSPCDADVTATTCKNSCFSHSTLG